MGGNLFFWMNSAQQERKRKREEGGRERGRRREEEEEGEMVMKEEGILVFGWVAFIFFLIKFSNYLLRFFSIFFFGLIS